jgi:phosphoglycolate phosphatase
MAYKCVCFDFDGTLADTEALMLKVYNEMARRYRLATIEPEAVGPIKEMALAEVLKHLHIPVHQWGKLARRGGKQLAARRDEILPFHDQLGDFLTELRRWTLFCGILTSNTAKNVHAFLTRYDLEPYFDFLKCAALFGKDRRLLRLCRRLHIRPSEMLYVGDEVRDIRACHRAGIDVVAVDWGYNTRASLAQAHPTYEVDTLDAIIDIVKTHNARSLEAEILKRMVIDDV